MPDSLTEPPSLSSSSIIYTTISVTLHVQTQVQHLPGVTGKKKCCYAHIQMKLHLPPLCDGWFLTPRVALFDFQQIMNTVLFFFEHNPTALVYMMSNLNMVIYFSQAN